MPLARMMLSSSQRCASKRRTCGSPRLSRTGCGGRITFITFTLVVACCEKAAGAQSLGLAADRFEDRRPARELILENPRRRGGPDVAHRLEAEPDELGLELAIGYRLLGDRVDGARIASGVPAGAKMPNVVCATMPGSPASIEVGRSGAPLMRVCEFTDRMRILPVRWRSRICAVALAESIGICPPITSVTAWPMPL